jgi:hypothetical protein
MQPQPGQLIRAPFLSAPAEVKKFEPRSDYYLLEVVLDDGQHTFKPLRITAEQRSQQGRIPAWKVGRYWRFHHATITRWVPGRHSSENVFIRSTAEAEKRSPLHD